MIRWCAYCQSYQGEQPPYGDYSVTHTLCARCVERNVLHDREHLENNVQPIARFYRRIWALRAAAPSDVAESLLDEGLGLGLAPFDLLIGILQPALHEVGDRWERGEVTVEDEHRLTALCLAMIERLEARHPELDALGRARVPDVALASVGDDAHTIGLRMVAFYLRMNGVSVATIPEGTSLDDIVRATREAHPRVLGIGVSLSGQLDAAVKLARRVAVEMPDAAPLVCIGGGAARGERLPDGTPAELCSDFRTLLTRATEGMHAS